MKTQTVAFIGLIQDNDLKKMANQGYSNAFAPFNLAKKDLTEVEADKEVERLKRANAKFVCFYYNVPENLKGKEQFCFWLRAVPYKEIYHQVEKP